MRLRNIHPGEILSEEFLKPLKITPYRLAKETGLTPIQVSDIIKAKRRITPETALKIAKFFDQTTPGFWLNIQNRFDLEEQTKILKKKLAKIKSFSIYSNSIIY